MQEREPFNFDVAFPTDVSQLEVFDRIGVDIVKTAYNGYNASMFAYGQVSPCKHCVSLPSSPAPAPAPLLPPIPRLRRAQTSSGKSFSMMGIRGTSLVGLIPRIANLLFYTARASPEREFYVEASYLEIYNERVRDLLDGNGA